MQTSGLNRTFGSATVPVSLSRSALTRGNATGVMTPEQESEAAGRATTGFVPLLFVERLLCARSWVDKQGCREQSGRGPSPSELQNPNNRKPPSIGKPPPLSPGLWASLQAPIHLPDESSH